MPIGTRVPGGDATSRRWVEQLRGDHPRHEEAVGELLDLLRRAARHELHRRRGQIPGLSGQELEDVADQCANDAVVNIINKVDEFRGLSRFTTWAYKFAIFEVSAKFARHRWRHHPPSVEELTFEHLPDTRAPRPDDHAEHREQLAVLTEAIEHELTSRQREVFVAVALNDVPIDVLALELGSNRNAVYKNLFDARRRLRSCLAEAGHALAEQGSSAR
jgi:RNA polymerase sigma-70 factor (ECF subfamily)